MWRFPLKTGVLTILGYGYHKQHEEDEKEEDEKEEELGGVVGRGGGRGSFSHCPPSIPRLETTAFFVRDSSGDP